MKQHRSRQGLTLRFDQRDHLPTIIEGQSLDTHTPKLLKIPWYMESNKGDVCSLLLEEPQVTRHTGDAKEPRVRDFAPDIVSNRDPLPIASDLTLAQAPSTSQLEWAVNKIQTQPERASMIYRRMRRRNEIRQVLLLDDLIRTHP